MLLAARDSGVQRVVAASSSSVENVVAANLLAADRTGVGGAVLNIATGARTSVNGLVDLIAGALGLEGEKQYSPERAGDVRDSWADVSLANAILDWKPHVSLEDGLRRTIAALESARA